MSEFFEVSNYVLQKGGVLPVARLAYRTIGTLNAARDNAVLIPSWYTGTDEQIEAYFCGPQRALTPDRWFIIMTNLLANVSPPDRVRVGRSKLKYPVPTRTMNSRRERI